MESVSQAQGPVERAAGNDERHSRAQKMDDGESTMGGRESEPLFAREKDKLAIRAIRGPVDYIIIILLLKH